MCKAGFAGDDAPRAVFRKLLESPYRVQVQIANPCNQPPLSDVPAIMGTSPPLESPFAIEVPIWTPCLLRRFGPIGLFTLHCWNMANLAAGQYHDRYGPEGLVRRR
jgi:hypothetical protein